MIPRVGDPVRPGIRYRHRPGVYAVLVRDGRVLLTFQADPVPEYQLPGGGMDAGEAPVAALHREVLEETGWRIAVRSRLGAFRRFTFMPDYDIWAEKVCHIYLARPALPRSGPTEPGHSAIWAEPARAVKLVANDGDRLFLARALGL
ncbi:NUDIX domain-containing protein [Silicimonas algicola]|uniref:8-oxo-dGTP diphosphatase n=1 Tax=Silicimonas algicola TaxID=1826607 RepID=A0A316G6R7_9RHOB|nr:NUDIX hydrolase [Silicimonas algicola]AZQ69432.1 NUDIX domain-containing protein [Silicimonas algicola]PWK56498.1 8-oxo-dGTP diphosphatase [Silicimonas algicola]